MQLWQVDASLHQKILQVYKLALTSIVTGSHEYHCIHRQPETAKVGAVNGVSINRPFTNWR